MDYYSYIPTLLLCAWLVPLASFAVLFVYGKQLCEDKPAVGGYVATAAIVVSGVLSFVSLFAWVQHEFPDHDSHFGHHAEHAAVSDETAHAEHGDAEHGDAEHGDAEHGDAGHGDGGHESEAKPYLAGDYYLLGAFGSLTLSIGYYIDALTITMFCMVTLIASCIHFYAMGYMHEEESEVTDHEVTLSDGSHLKRPGRFFRFFQYLSLFCFSMLGIVLAGNIAMVFIFWELVGICSYFLIGFYIERQSASTAANKAFIVNRVGDFGMIIGLMALWTALGTFNFGDVDGKEGIFSAVRSASNHHALQTPDGMVRLAAAEEARKVVHAMEPDASLAEQQIEIDKHIEGWRTDEEGRPNYGYWLLVVAGIGIFCGCVGKSAQFPLHTWLPDAMEGPTPVSALVHSATMVAAGVYLVARFYPVFAPEVLLVIATSGCITLFIGATIAITATDIKRVLAYSTISQLGYMMLALGVGGWIAGVMHLITHAFFKSLLFMCSGSVIHAVHTNEMTEMGGLRKKMPITAYTMLIGCLAISGAGVPFLIGFSGYYSKDKILEQAYSFTFANNFGLSSIFFLAAAGGAAITTFYMFRLWFMTFAGEPRDQHRYDHAHESPPVMAYPLIVLAIFAIAVAWSPAEALLAGGVALVAAIVLLIRSRNWPKFVAYPAVLGTALAIWLVLGSALLETTHESERGQATKEELRFETLATAVKDYSQTYGASPANWDELLGSVRNNPEASEVLSDLYYEGVVLLGKVQLAESGAAEGLLAYEANTKVVDGWACMVDGSVTDLSSTDFKNIIEAQTKDAPQSVENKSQFFWWRIWGILTHVGSILITYAAQLLVTILAGFAVAVVLGRSQITIESARRNGLIVGGIGACVLLFTGVWGLKPLMLEGLLQQAYPDGALLGAQASYFEWMQWSWPSEPISHDYAVPITLLAFATAVVGFTLALLMYGLGYLNAEDARRQFAVVHHFLRNKWWFDEIYDFLFVQPCHLASKFFSGIDSRLIDRFVDGLAWVVRWFSDAFEFIADRIIVDGLVNSVARCVRAIGLSLRVIQTGSIRHYVMFIAIGAVVLFLLITIFLNPASLTQG